MSRIFLIPGLGADSRVYRNINLPEIIKGKKTQVIPVNWLEPNATDTLSEYAQNIISHYDIRKNDIVIGNSLGGMLAVEIANRIELNKVILISSIKTDDEAPGYFKIFRTVPVYKLLSDGILNTLDRFVKPAFGHMSPEETWLFEDMLRKSSPTFMRWAMYAVLHWQNQTVPPRLYHITGDKDLVFDYRLIKDPTLVAGGTHIMIFDKADEINRLLAQILAE